MKLFTFPYAGGTSAKFIHWKSYLPPEIQLEPIEYPGHGKLIGQPTVSDFNQLLDVLMEEINSKLEHPFVFFGHSLGSLVCFEITRRLQNLGRQLPKLLIVSGAMPPHLPRRFEKISRLSDEEFMAAVQKRHGTIPQEILNNRAALQFFIPPLKADYYVGDNYHYVEGAAVNCPLVAVAGDHDYVPDGQLKEWKVHAAAMFKSIIIPGDHFSPIRQPEQLILKAILEPLVEIGLVH